MQSCEPARSVGQEYTPRSVLWKVHLAEQSPGSRNGIILGTEVEPQNEARWLASVSWKA